MANQLEMVECLNMLCVAFPNYQPNVESILALWKTIFFDMQGETLKAAILVCLTEKRAFAPSAGEIRTAAMELHARASGIPDAYTAYAETVAMPADMTLTRAVKEGGQWYIDKHPLVFTHPIVEKTARLMGWPKTFPTDMPAADRSQFVKAYDLELSLYMADHGRLPAIQQYIESKRPELQGNAPALVAGITKKLTAG